MPKVLERVVEGWNHFIYHKIIATELREKLEIGGDTLEKLCFWCQGTFTATREGKRIRISFKP